MSEAGAACAACLLTGVCRTATPRSITIRHNSAVPRCSFTCKCVLHACTCARVAAREISLNNCEASDISGIVESTRASARSADPSRSSRNLSQRANTNGQTDKNTNIGFLRRLMRDYLGLKGMGRRGLRLGLRLCLRHRRRWRQACLRLGRLPGNDSNTNSNNHNNKTNNNNDNNNSNNNI
jgi:hypothetical protein